MVFITAALAVGGAVMGYIGAQSANKALAKQAKETQLALNAEETEIRVQTADQIRQRAAVGGMAMAEGENQFAGQTGLSISMRLAAMAGDMTMDTEALKAAEEAQIASIEFQKRNAVYAARSKMKDPALETAAGFLKGASMGMGIESGLAKLDSIKAANKQLKNVGPIYGDIDSGRLGVLTMVDSGLRERLSSTTRSVRGLMNTRGPGPAF